MAAKNKAAKAGAGAFAAGKSVKDNKYVKKLIQDADLRDNIRTGVTSARKAYGRIANGKSPIRAITEDKKTQKELRQAATSLRSAASTLRGARRARSAKRRGRLVAIGLVGGGLAVALNEGARKKVLDKLFGAEEPAGYTPPAGNANTPASQPVGSASPE
jgi:hypothetical protein